MKNKDYKDCINYQSYSSIANYAIKNGYDVDIIEGVLNDTYIIYANKEIKIDNLTRDYIVLYPLFQTCCSNTFHILMTNDKKKIELFG